MHGNVVLLREEERLGLAEWLGDTNKPKLLPPGLAARPPKAVVHGLPVGPRHHAQKVDVLADRAREEEGGGEVLQPSGLRAEDAPLALPQLQAQLVGSLQGGRGTDSGGEKKKMGWTLQDALSCRLRRPHSHCHSWSEDGREEGEHAKQAGGRRRQGVWKAVPIAAAFMSSLDSVGLRPLWIAQGLAHWRTAGRHQIHGKGGRGGGRGFVTCPKMCEI